jgi:hypothetical protein
VSNRASWIAVRIPSRTIWSTVDVSGVHGDEHHADDPEATDGGVRCGRQSHSAGPTAQRYTFTHDAVDQLTAAVLTDTNTTPTLLKRQAWAYDAAGDRIGDQIVVVNNFQRIVTTWSRVK